MTKRDQLSKFLPVLVILAGLCVYNNSLTGPFIFDDLLSIQDNPRIRTLWPLWEGLSTTSRPVVWLTLAINYAVGGLNVWGYHAVNLAIHILAALVLYALVRRTVLLLVSDSKRDEATWLAGAVAMIWVVHPLQTQCVTYVIQRGESLMALFYLLTLYCATRRGWWHVAAVACCALGIDR